MAGFILPIRFPPWSKDAGFPTRIFYEYEQVLESLSLQLLLSHISSPVYVLFYSENLCAVEAWSTSKFSGLVGVSQHRQVLSNR